MSLTGGRIVESRYLQYEKKAPRKVTCNVHSELGILIQAAPARHSLVLKETFQGFGPVCLWDCHAHRAEAWISVEGG